MDTYSENKYVQLNADIDLTDSLFSGIPIFNGEFEGNGHIVQGLKLKDKSANPGFFGIIKSNGIVKDLKIKGEIKPEGIVEAVGAIAGADLGEFKNNYFYSDNLSGINSYSISGCYGPVYAERMNKEFSLEEMDMSKLDDEDKLVKTGAIILGFGAILVASIMLTALLKMRKKTKEKKQS